MSSLRPVSGTAEEILALLRDWDAADDPEPLVIETSGSTGRPKRVALSRDAMRASALATQERLGGPGTWVLNLPPAYVAGVQVLYRSVVAGTEPVVFDGSFADALAAAPGRAYVSLVPTQLVRLLRDRTTAPARRRRARGLRRRARRRRPAASRRTRARPRRPASRIVQTYGMSETCGGCVYDGLPLDGVEVRIDDDGEVLLRGPVLFDGYDGEPERTARALRDGWFHTDDLGEIGDDGRLRVLGRADDVIISGGVKVPAPAVAAAARGARRRRARSRWSAYPTRSGASAWSPSSPRSTRLTLDGLRDLVEPRSWAPRQLVLVEELPELPNGKPDRVAIRELAARG